MDCPICGSKQTKVIDSREPGARRDRRGRRAHILGEVAPAWEWWSADYRARRRHCLGCDHRWITIEVPLSDLEDVLSMDNDEREEARRVFEELNS